MKQKFVVCTIIVLLAAFLSGCGDGNKNTILELNQPVEIEDVANFELQYVFFSDILTAPNQNSVHAYFESDGSSMQFMDCIVKYKNLGTSAIDVRNAMYLTASADGSDYESYLTAMEKDYGSNLSNYDSIEPMGEATLHCAVNVPKDAQEFVANLHIDGKTYSIEVNKNKFQNPIETVEIGDTLEKDDFANITLKSIDWVNRIEPSNTSRSYWYLEPENNNNIFLTVALDIQCTSSSSLEISNVISGVFKYDDKYEYNSSICGEDQSNNMSVYVDLPPLTTTKSFMFFEVPKELEGESGSILLYFGEKYYNLEF